MNFFQFERHLLNVPLPGCLRLLEEGDSFYGNVCRICFTGVHLKKCSRCKIISYCSEMHQFLDWPLHKKLCKALSIVKRRKPCKTNCTQDEFNACKNMLAANLEKRMNHKLSKFEMEISQLPWVCAVCFDENVKFECEDCKAVGYCSIFHKQQDIAHKTNCQALKLAKIVDSIYFTPSVALNFRLNSLLYSLPQNISVLPASMEALELLLQPKFFLTKNMNDILNSIIFSREHSVGATILFVLEKMACISSRVYNKKQSVTAVESETPESLRWDISLTKEISLDHTMVIHFVASDFYEIRQDWFKHIMLIVKWLQNIDYVEVILVGETLLTYKTPNFESIIQKANLQYYPFQYETIVDRLMKPDLVIFFNYGTSKEKEVYQNESCQNALFHHKNVPLIVTSTREKLLTEFVNKIKQLNDVKVEMNVQKNPFADGRPQRVWDEKNMSTCYYNEYISVLTRKSAT